MGDRLAEMHAKLAAMSPAEKEAMRRILTGEADKDHILRGEAQSAIRELILSPRSLQNREYQAGLQAANRAIYSVKARS